MSVKVQTGLLNIEIESKILGKGKEIKLEIRDSDLKLVKPETTDRKFDLPIGLYEVSAVLEDGVRTSKIAAVNLETPVLLKLAPEPSKLPLSSEESTFLPVHNVENTSIKEETLLATSFNVIVKAEVHYWLLSTPKGAMTEVASAQIKRGNQIFDISLPIGGEHRLSPICYVERQVESVFSPIHINISPNRFISSALEQMAISRQIHSAAQLAKNAIWMLNKPNLSDPSGAALAALILYKIGKLDESRSDLRKLKDNHMWLPDCKVLYSLILMQLNPECRSEALAYALEASSQRFLFTETFSLLLDMLRYWPEENRSSEHDEAIHHLGEIAGKVDWSSMYLCTNYSND